MPVACRNQPGPAVAGRIHKYILDKPDVGREYTLSSKLPSKVQRRLVLDFFAFIKNFSPFA
jgi:hypothetical protein